MVSVCVCFCVTPCHKLTDKIFETLAFFPFAFLSSFNPCFSIVSLILDSSPTVELGNLCVGLHPLTNPIGNLIEFSIVLS